MFSNRTIKAACGFGLLIVLIASIAITARAQNWPSFRGPSASGVADGKPTPTSWDATKGTNVCSSAFRRKFVG